MAAPAVMGIPWLAATLGGMLTTMIGFFSKFMAAKWAVLMAVISAIIVLTGTLIATFEGLMSGIMLVFPGNASWGLVVPWNFSACISAYISARLAKYVYQWHTTVLQWKLL